jgi:lipopolysaccharide transport system ATP-binding protein
MFVRVAFALIAHVDADVLIVDEALAVGDAMFAQKCMRYMGEFMQRGTLIFVSHDMGSVRSLCNRVIWLDKGKIRAEGDPKSVGDAYLESCYAQQQPVALKTATAPRPIQDGAEATQVKAAAPQEDFRLQGGINPLHIKAVPVFDFGGFGAGQARIDHVVLRDEWGQNLNQTEGGRKTSLRIEAQLAANLDALVFGYFIRNRMGLNIFGDNTFLAHAERPVSGQAGERVCAVFEFIMPFLPKGEYSVCVALATGSNQQHVQQHWVNEALIIQSIDNHVHADVRALPSISMVVGKA